MKSKNHSPAALLVSKDPARTHKIRVELTTGNWYEITTNDHQRAIPLFNHIRAQGIYQEQWIESVTLNDESR